MRSARTSEIGLAGDFLDQDAEVDEVGVGIGEGAGIGDGLIGDEGDQFLGVQACSGSDWLVS